MVNKNQLTIIGLIITLAGLTPFSGILDFMIKPSFEVETSGYGKIGDFTESVYIRNIGLAQAKNAIADIFSSKPIMMKYTQCPEGTLSNNNSTRITITFERFSQNIVCHVPFHSGWEHNIYRIDVTAEDAEGYSWSPQKENLTLGTQYAIVSISTLLAVALTIYVNRTHQRKSLSFNVGGHPTNFGTNLIKTYGPGFNEDDEQILRAIKKEKETVEEISIFTDLEERYVEERLEFMEGKGTVEEIAGTWYLDSEIENKVPK